MHLNVHESVLERLRWIHANSRNKTEARIRQDQYLKEVGMGSRNYPTFSKAERRKLIYLSQETEKLGNNNA